MALLEAVLLLATLLCSLVAGFLFAFAVVAMPGIRALGDREFVRAFQEMDRVIQDNHPLFLLVWVGSVVALLAAAVLGFGRLDPAGRWLIGTAALGYLAAVQLPTAAINVPLNRRIQRVDADIEGEAAVREARTEFEARWNRWNAFRAAAASLVAALLMVVLLRI